MILVKKKLILGNFFKYKFGILKDCKILNKHFMIVIC
jgi:hypothetical protein